MGLNCTVQINKRTTDRGGGFIICYVLSERKTNDYISSLDRVTDRVSSLSHL